RHSTRPPGTDPDPGGERPLLPDPDELAHLDQLQLTAPSDDDRPVLPRSEKDRTDWTWLDGNDLPPF
ncbi:MAG: hypothetical protein LH469_06550, partial [Frankiaceae bacterium]|nr:hypothetical protein [Frankiaceae bacterium]